MIMCAFHKPMNRIQQKRVPVRKRTVRVTPQWRQVSPIKRSETLRPVQKKQPQGRPFPKYYPSKTGQHAHSPSADRAAYYRQQREFHKDLGEQTSSDSDSDSDSDVETKSKSRKKRKHKHKHKHHHCCCTECYQPRPCAWSPQSPCLGNCCGGYYDSVNNGYVVYDTGNPSCTSRPGAYISPDPLIPWTNSLPYPNLCSPCGCYGTEWDVGDPRPPPIPTQYLFPPVASQFGNFRNFC